MRPLTAMWLLLVLCGSAYAQEIRQATGLVRFVAVDIYIDPDGQPLAAYQLDFYVAGVVARIVGIEGGAHPAFSEAPYYDPAAIRHERVRLAAFNTGTGRTLPTGKTRIATVHLEIRDTHPPQYGLKVETAATVGGTKIKITATYQERKPQ